MEEKLIKKVMHGNEQAFRMLVEQYRIYIYKSVYAVLRNQNDTEDAVQEIFLKVYTSLPRYKYQGFKTWITRIAVNHAIDIKRKKKLSQEDPMTDLQANYLVDSQIISMDQAMLKKEQKQFIRERLSELPSNYRDVVIGFYIEEKTYQQLAEEQQVQVKTIETKLYRARQWMRKNWKEDDFL